jgi:hypothetical protein
MKIEFYKAEFDVPDIMIDKFAKDFEGLPGSGQTSEVHMLRDSIDSVLDVVTHDPEILHEPEYLADFIKALAMKKAMERHGIFYDA